MHYIYNRSDMIAGIKKLGVHGVYSNLYLVEGTNKMIEGLTRLVLADKNHQNSEPIHRTESTSDVCQTSARTSTQNYLRVLESEV